MTDSLLRQLRDRQGFANLTPLRVQQAWHLVLSIYVQDVDLAGAPYIGHLVRVFSRVDQCDVVRKDEDLLIAALAHDIVEDGKLTLDEIGWWFGAHAQEYVDSLSRRRGEQYTAYIERVAKSWGASLIKMADLADNQDQTRLRPEQVKAYKSLMARYAAAEARLRQQWWPNEPLPWEYSEGESKGDTSC